MIRLIATIWRGLVDMARHPLANLFTLVTVSLVVLLAGIFLMLLENVNKELLRNRGQVEFQVYWEVGADPGLVAAQWKELSSITGLSSMRTYGPDQALTELAETLTDTTDFSWMAGQNPLPHTAWLSFTVDPARGETWAHGLLSQLEGLPGVEAVHYNPFQLELAQGWISLAHGLLWPIIGVLGLIVALVVGNTVRLSLLTRRDEIEILSLVGAKPWYIRGPLMASGALLGAGGSALGLLALLAAQLQLAHVLDAPPLYMTIDFLPVEQWAALAGIATLVCALSSFVAVRN